VTRSLGVPRGVTVGGGLTAANCESGVNGGGVGVPASPPAAAGMGVRVGAEVSVGLRVLVGSGVRVGGGVRVGEGVAVGVGTLVSVMVTE